MARAVLTRVTKDDILTAKEGTWGNERATFESQVDGSNSVYGTIGQYVPVFVSKRDQAIMR